MNILAIFRAQNRSESLGSCALLKREKLARLSRGVGTFLSSLPSAPPQTLTTTNTPSKLFCPTNGSHKGSSCIFLFHIMNLVSPSSLSVLLLLVVVSAANRTQIHWRYVAIFFLAGNLSGTYHICLSFLQVKLPVSNSPPKPPGRPPR